MTVLVDTSVWVDYLRGIDGVAASSLRQLLAQDQHGVVTTEPIVMELLAGANDEMMLARLQRLVDGLPSLTVDPHVDFRSAAAIWRTARRAGLTVRNLSDCLIAAIAIRHGTALLHKDVDFEVIAQLTPLAGRSVR